MSGEVCQVRCVGRGVPDKVCQVRHADEMCQVRYANEVSQERRVRLGVSEEMCQMKCVR